MYHRLISFNFKKGFSAHGSFSKMVHGATNIFEINIIGEKKSAQWTLLFILQESLKVLHPFMPFVTEEIWGLMDNKDLLMVTQWPQ